MPRILAFLFLLFCTLPPLQAQDTAAIHLQEVQVIDYRLPERVSFKQSTFDKQVLRENLTATLGELLALKTPIFVKNYGAGGAATPSFRGTGASHTQVFWNGIHLNSPMLGQVDLSMFPVALTDEVAVHYGAASLLYGTGGLGGSIQLNSHTDWETQRYLLLSQSANSLGNYISNGSLTLGNGKVQSTTKAFFKQAANRFDFVNPLQPGSPTWSNRHSRQQQYGLLQELSARLSERQTASIKAWYQADDRQLPPSMDKQEEYADLQNQSLRLLGEWKLQDAQQEYVLRTAYLLDDRHYRKELDGGSGLKEQTSQSLAHTWQLNAIGKRRLSEQWVAQAGARLLLDRIESSDYLDMSSGQQVQREQLTAEVYGSAEWIPSERFNLSLLLRQQWIDGKANPLLPSLGVHYLLMRERPGSLALKANLSRNFHAPSLNDRYWGAAGNPDLLPEGGWTGEIGGEWSSASASPWRWRYELTAFSSLIDDWIVWQPRGSSGNLWKPLNLRQVFARGVEQVVSADYRQGPLRVQLYASYAYTRTENRLPYSQLDASVGKQLIYTPVHSLQAYARLGWKQYLLRLEQTAYGRRLTQTDGSEWLPPYALTNLVLGRSFQHKGHRLVAEGRIDNLFGFHYQSVARKPMPGRTFQLTLTYHLQ